jgi:hypothetical protein
MNSFGNHSMSTFSMSVDQMHAEPQSASTSALSTVLQSSPINCDRTCHRMPDSLSD